MGEKTGLALGVLSRQRGPEARPWSAALQPCRLGGLHPPLRPPLPHLGLTLAPADTMGTQWLSS